MTTSLPARTPALEVFRAAATVATHGQPRTECRSLPVVWEQPPLKPRAMPIRIVPPAGTLWMGNQPTALRGFGINE